MANVSPFGFVRDLGKKTKPQGETLGIKTYFSDEFISVSNGS